MYAITGVSGRVGGIVARTLLSVRAVVRDPTKGAAWKERGSDVALADMNDASALTAAFTRVDGVFVLFPPIFDPTPGFPEAKAIIADCEADEGRLSLDDRRAGNTTESTSAAWPVGAGAGCRALTGLLPKGRLVHGECGLGRHAST
jgi:hypothetical protein